MGLTRLDLSHTQVTGSGLRALNALSSLRDLRLAGITGLSARHVQVLSFLFKALLFSFFVLLIGSNPGVAGQRGSSRPV